MELTQSQSDWIADRIHIEAEMLILQGENQRNRDERADLLDEISRLRQELKDTIRQKEMAEERCAQLEKRAIVVEIEVAEKRERDNIDDIGLPVEFVQARLRDAGDVEMHRELAEFSLSRASADVAKLAIWLEGCDMGDHASQLVTDYCRQHPISASVDLVREVEEVSSADHSSRARTLLLGCVEKSVSRRPIEDLFGFLEGYLTFSSEGAATRVDAFLAGVASRWLRRWSHYPDRSNRFFDIVDFLDAQGQRQASVKLIEEQVGYTGSVTKFGQIIAESNREADIRVFASRWLKRIKSVKHGDLYRLARQMKKMSDFSNPLMFELVLQDIFSVYDPLHIAKIYVYSLDDSRDQTTFTKRLIRVIVQNGLAEEVHGYLLANFGMPFDGGAPRNASEAN
ncbi:hypothetical protein D9753_20360 [Streptomyces dangxiongensis]|uniref:Uncharacterized protein n=2 Tax=Streptomyces dangxiongensis TaxID=1442032 RepID=A0A3G2JEU5_9ACTN|nr:hypothetical protein D9753_20360 [Streptomyces dangxiongensis]